MKKIFLLTVVILFGCDKQKKIPEGILSKDKMVALEIEFQLLEAKLKVLNISRDSGEVLYDHYSNEILENEEVEREVYEKSYVYYMKDIEGMDEINEVVIDSLSLRERLGKE